MTLVWVTEKQTQAVHRKTYFGMRTRLPAWRPEDVLRPKIRRKWQTNQKARKVWKSTTSSSHERSRVWRCLGVEGGHPDYVLSRISSLGIENKIKTTCGSHSLTPPLSPLVKKCYAMRNVLRALETEKEQKNIHEADEDSSWSHFEKIELLTKNERSHYAVKEQAEKRARGKTKK